MTVIGENLSYSEKKLLLIMENYVFVLDVKYSVHVSVVERERADCFRKH